MSLVDKSTSTFQQAHPQASLSSPSIRRQYFTHYCLLDFFGSQTTALFAFIMVMNQTSIKFFSIISIAT